MTEPKSHLRPVSMADSDATTMAPSVVDTKEPSEAARPTTTSTSPSREVSPPPQSNPVQDEKEMGEQAAAAGASDDEDDEANFVYPTAWKLAAITIALCLSVFCMALDNTIIATAIPRITDQFKALNDVGWYGSAYLLTTCATQLIYGKFYTFYSIKWVYLSALFIFEVGSSCAALHPTRPPSSLAAPLLV